jgi:glutaredoxin
MEIKHVKGRKKGDIFLYALSTCGWCKKTKRILDEKGLEYSYVDVDLLDDSESEKAMEEVRRWNPSCSFPTIVINGKHAIKGYLLDEIKRAIGE